MISAGERGERTKTGEFSGTLVRLLCCIRQNHNEGCSTKVKVQTRPRMVAIWQIKGPLI